MVGVYWKLLEVFDDDDTTECCLLGDVFELAPNVEVAEEALGLLLILLRFAEEVQVAGEAGCSSGLMTGEGWFTLGCVVSFGDSSIRRPPVARRCSK